MSRRAASSPRPGARNCWSRTGSATLSTSSTQRSGQLRRKWSGNSARKRDAAPNETNRGRHMQYLIGLGGIVLILAIAVLFSANRRWIRLRVVGAAFALQAVIAALVLGTPWGKNVIGAMSTGV